MKKLEPEYGRGYPFCTPHRYVALSARLCHAALLIGSVTARVLSSSTGEKKHVITVLVYWS